MRADRRIELRIDEIASGQYGVLSLRQARQAGLTARQVEYRLAKGLWRRVRRAVYRIAGTGRCWQQDLMAACLATGGVASHQSAAALFGLVPAPSRPHVTVGRTASARAPDAVVHRCALGPDDTCLVGPIPCTRPARTLVDCAGQLPLAALCEATDSALCAGLAEVTWIREAAQRASRAPGRRGGSALRRALAVWTPGPAPGSVAEVRLLRRLIALGVPEPERQFVVRDRSGRFAARADLAWPERKVILEYDGARWHGPRQGERDDAREDRLRALGWRVERVRWADLVPAEAAQLVRRLGPLVGWAGAA